MNATKTFLLESRAMSSKFPASSWTAAGGGGGLILDFVPDFSVMLFYVSFDDLVDPDIEVADDLQSCKGVQITSAGVILRFLRVCGEPLESWPPSALRTRYSDARNETYSGNR